jgi:putative component of membrane protein insertase Oxa1/YidC/SpoIIIJ protein YidD
MLRLAARLGADVMPRPVQTARVTMSRMPTCNRIVPGGWDIPPDDPSLARLLAVALGIKA